MTGTVPRTVKLFQFEVNSVRFVGRSCSKLSPISYINSFPPQTTLAPVSAIDSLSTPLSWECPGKTLILSNSALFSISYSTLWLASSTLHPTIMQFCFLLLSMGMKCA